MEAIIIPNITDIVGSAENTVDRFCTWAEALDVPVKDRPEERFLSVAKSILKKISASPADVDGLHRDLGSIILSLSSECYQNATIKGGKLPSMTPLQKQALSRKVPTFDEMARSKLVDGEERLHKQIKDHQELVAKFETVQQIDLGVFKSMEKAKNSEFAEKFLNKSEALFTRVAGVEDSVRVSLRKISDELVQDIKDSIVRRITHGVQYLEHAVSKFQNSETTEKCLKMIRSIDKVGVAYNLMKANSTFYFCPQVLQHLQTVGWRERIPKARMDKIDAEATDAGPDLGAKLEIKTTMKNPRPGMLKLRRGMKIKQKIFDNDLDLAFGSRRRCKLLPISWGYFYKSHAS